MTAVISPRFPTQRPPKPAHDKLDNPQAKEGLKGRTGKQKQYQQPPGGRRGPRPPRAPGERAGHQWKTSGSFARVAAEHKCCADER